MKAASDQVANRLTKRRRAYTQLAASAHTLPEEAPLYWRERLLLRLVEHLYRRRLAEVGGVLAAVGEEGKSRGGG